MSYSAEISRSNPTFFLFLIDQSGSMEQAFGATGRKKSQDVADAVNRLLHALVYRCSGGPGQVFDRYYVGVIGYNDRVASSLGGALEGRQGFLPISDIANNPLRLESRTKKVPDGAGGLVDQTVTFPVWFDPVARGKTHMVEALSLARDVVADFVGNFPTCYPPTVINITDGKATDGNEEKLLAAADELRSVASEDGGTLLFNMHISEKVDRPIEFPNSEATLQDDYARLLYRMSSPLPAEMLRQARIQEVDVPDGARGFVFQADLVSVIRFLQIGTTVGTNSYFKG